CPDPTLPPITLQHVGHRWYEPAIGRFVQRDPIGIEGGLNVYAYCLNNPLPSVDPSGHGVGGWFKRGIRWAGRILKKVGQKLTGQPAPNALGPCVPVVRGLGALADGLGPVLRYRSALEQTMGESKELGLGGSGGGRPKDRPKEDGPQQ
ncbi:MAG: RHS repeat-associated core domain-containing protein, partial [Planctomycetes bacterium]|nr:RHS repeat-associated core domain-containing protein [Planctomycetota bacterium]